MEQSVTQQGEQSVHVVVIPKPSAMGKSILSAAIDLARMGDRIDIPIADWSPPDTKLNRKQRRARAATQSR